VKKLKTEKVKRSRIILSAILTFAIALLGLGFGAYLGYVTLNINYVTIGTMTPMVGGLLVVAGFFIFFGCVGGVISLKEIFISSRNEDKFSAYKGALISAIVYYVVIAIICIVGFIMSLVSYVPSNFTWTILALCVLTLVLCGGAFYCVLKELKEHKKKKKAKDASKNDTPIYNMNLDASDIRRFSNATLNTNSSQQYNQAYNHNIPNAEHYNQQTNQSQGAQNSGYDNHYYEHNEYYSQASEYDKQRLYDRLLNKESKPSKEDVDLINLAEKLMQLEELRKAGLINDQEYQSLKKNLI